MTKKLIVYLMFIGVILVSCQAGGMGPGPNTNINDGDGEGGGIIGGGDGNGNGALTSAYYLTVNGKFVKKDKLLAITQYQVGDQNVNWLFTGVDTLNSFYINIGNAKDDVLFAINGVPSWYTGGTAEWSGVYLNDYMDSDNAAVVKMKQAPITSDYRNYIKVDKEIKGWFMRAVLFNPVVNKNWTFAKKLRSQDNRGDIINWGDAKPGETLVDVRKMGAKPPLGMSSMNKMAISDNFTDPSKLTLNLRGNPYATKVAKAVQDALVRTVLKRLGDIGAIGGNSSYRRGSSGVLEVWIEFEINPSSRFKFHPSFPGIASPKKLYRYTVTVKHINSGANGGYFPDER